jgi:hypothetical protein
MKASLRQGSAYAAMIVTGGHGVRMQFDYTHDIAGLPGPVWAASPRWLRLVRTGDTLTGYDSADGTHWTMTGTARLPGLATAVQAGIFVTSPDSVTSENAGSTMASAVFDHLTMAGAQPGGQWAGQDFGAGAAYNPLSGGYRQAGGSSRPTPGQQHLHTAVRLLPAPAVGRARRPMRLGRRRAPGRQPAAPLPRRVNDPEAHDRRTAQFDETAALNSLVR